MMCSYTSKSGQHPSTREARGAPSQAGGARDAVFCKHRQLSDLRFVHKFPPFGGEEDRNRVVTSTARVLLSPRIFSSPSLVQSCAFGGPFGREFLLLSALSSHFRCAFLRSSGCVWRI